MFKKNHQVFGRTEATPLNGIKKIKKKKQPSATYETLRRAAAIALPNTVRIVTIREASRYVFFRIFFSRVNCTRKTR
jgi:hypothetical protein